MVAREQVARTRRALSMDIHRVKHFFWQDSKSVAVLVVNPKAVAKVDMARYLVLDQAALVDGMVQFRRQMYCNCSSSGNALETTGRCASPNSDKTDPLTCVCPSV